MSNFKRKSQSPCCQHITDAWMRWKRLSRMDLLGSGFCRNPNSKQWHMRLYGLLWTIILIVKSVTVILTVLIFIKDHFSETLKPSTKCVRYKGQHDTWSCEQFLMCPRNETLSVSRSCVSVAWSQVKGADPIALIIVRDASLTTAHWKSNCKPKHRWISGRSFCINVKPECFRIFPPLNHSDTIFLSQNCRIQLYWCTEISESRQNMTWKGATIYCLADHSSNNKKWHWWMMK